MFKPERVIEFLERCEAKPSLKGLMDIIQDEVDELKKAVVDNDKKEILDAVVDGYWVLTNAIYAAGIDLRDLQNMIDAVDTSNFSKICKTEKEAIETVKLYSKGLHPDKMGKVMQTSYVKTIHGEWVVINSEGKILKSHLYKKVEDLI